MEFYVLIRNVLERKGIQIINSVRSVVASGRIVPWVIFVVDRELDPELPYENINSIGKQWIRRFALALTKEMLGQVRGKFATVPIPGESVTLNASELLGQAKAEQDLLREELKTLLDELTYDKLAAVDSTMQDSTKKVLENVPVGIFVG